MTDAENHFVLGANYGKSKKNKPPIYLLLFDRKSICVRFSIKNPSALGAKHRKFSIENPSALGTDHRNIFKENPLLDANHRKFSTENPFAFLFIENSLVGGQHRWISENGHLKFSIENLSGVNLLSKIYQVTGGHKKFLFFLFIFPIENLGAYHRKFFIENPCA